MPATAAVPTGNIDPSERGTLTIHKYEQPASGTLGPNDGTEIAVPSDANPLGGVTFSVQRVVGVDLTTPEGWEAAETLTVADLLGATPTHPLDADIGGTTETDGTLAITDMPLGLYLVQETAAGPNNIVAPAQPFLVAVPQPMGDGTWLYDVHVYPKNALQDAPVKSVDDSKAYLLGDVVDWGIKIPVAKLPQGANYSTYSIVDELEPELGFKGIELQLEDGATVTPLVEGTHYTLTAPADGANGTVAVEFTAAGLALLNGASGAAEITGTLSTNVLSIGTGTITNQFEVVVNGRGTPSNEPETKWGALQIIKHAAGNDIVVLEGATFDLYTQAGYEAGDDPIVADLTTNEFGEINVGLKAGEYVLVETAAPAGYQLNTDPIAVTIVAGSVAEPNVYRVPNQQGAFELPLTGGTGTLAFTIIGLALIAFAGGAFLVARKRRSVGADAE